MCSSHCAECRFHSECRSCTTGQKCTAQRARLIDDPCATCSDPLREIPEWYARRRAKASAPPTTRRCAVSLWVASRSIGRRWKLNALFVRRSRSLRETAFPSRFYQDPLLTLRNTAAQLPTERLPIDLFSVVQFLGDKQARPNC
jgi:hypothetical protein